MRWRRVADVGLKLPEDVPEAGWTADARRCGKGEAHGLSRPMIGVLVEDDAFTWLDGVRARAPKTRSSAG
jgi:hypothetical protein